MNAPQKCAMRTGFAKGVLAAAQADPKVMLLGCDVTRSLFLDRLRSELPKQFLSVGIAEQNAASIAAGLALSGRKPIFATYAAFATTRALDQIRMSICYNHAPVLIAGAHAGLSVGPDGGSHQALEDIAVMRTLPGMTVVLPADANETQTATEYYLKGIMTTPIYMRFGRNEIPNFTPENQEFTPGAQCLHKGDSLLAIVTHGAMVWNCLQVVQQLENNGLHPTLIQIRTLGDGLAEKLLLTLQNYAHILVVEEHQVQGGVGGYVAERLSDASTQKTIPSVTCLGVNGRFGQSGTPEELYEIYGLSTDKILSVATNLLYSTR